MPVTVITALLPCYNAADYLPEALASVRRQTRAVDEILVVDDGSTDASAAVAEAAGARVIRLAANSGHAVARNIGLREARGDLIAWLDADDYWEPEHVEVVTELLDRFPRAAVAFSAIRLVGALSGVWKPRLPPDQLVDAFWESFHHTPGPQTTAISRRAPLLELGGYNEAQRTGLDFDMWLRVSRHYPLVATHLVTGNYRWHPGQISRNPEKQYRETYLARLRLRDTVRAEGNLGLAAAIEERIRWVWEQDLDSRWRKREMEAVRFFLRFAPLVPDAPETVRRRFARRAWLPRPLLRAWDLGPAETARKVVTRLFG
jgi:glycosyltransferase involved in cell wall biosynthesis